MSQETYYFPCPHCNTTLGIPKSMAGVQGPCPNCRQVLIAPPPPATAPFQAPPQMMAPNPPQPPAYNVPQPQPAYQATAYAQQAAAHAQQLATQAATAAAQVKVSLQPHLHSPTSAQVEQTAQAAKDVGAKALKAANLSLGPLKLETAPAFGQGSMSAADERLYAMLAHLFSIIIWPWKRKESPVVDAHGKESLNFAITLFICLFPLGFLVVFLAIALHLPIIATLYSYSMMLVNLALLGLIVYAMMMARDGKLLRYPINFRFIK